MTTKTQFRNKYLKNVRKKLFPNESKRDAFAKNILITDLTEEEIETKNKLLREIYELHLCPYCSKKYSRHMSIGTETFTITLTCNRCDYNEIIDNDAIKSKIQFIVNMYKERVGEEYDGHIFAFEGKFVEKK